ncbi:hypothetical protein IC220_01550 [Wolbachia endosymbiont of Pentalonia nigronervosa]|jgi:hypothetical protein|nr:hypothetical protein [Wolbachia endosymbiont of Pentalonia nigronervosa]
MGEVLHGCARTTETVPRAIQNSQESIAKLSERYHLNPKTIIKWKKRSFTKKVSAKYLQSKKSVI